MTKRIPDGLSGVFAALPTPFGKDGNPLWAPFDRLVAFALHHGLKGLCLGGATGEYTCCSVESRTEMFQRVARRTKGNVRLICAVGSENATHVKQLARAALDAGASAVLLPPPVFMPYAQDDLVDFVRQVSSELPLPVLLYHIPQCTRDLGIANVLRLIEEVPNIIGLKDSSGDRPNLAAIDQTQIRSGLAFFIGSDDLLSEAFEHGARGVISGVASACPELVLPLYEAASAGKAKSGSWLQLRLNEFISHVRGLPPAWAIKLALQVRGLEMGSLAWPMSANLRRKAHSFQDWLAGQIAAYEASVADPS